MSESSAPVLHHTCFLVRDLEATAQKLADSMQIGPWNIWTIMAPEGKVRGKPNPFSFRVALATVGGGTFELITPHTGRTVYDEHLEQFGEGYHHICMFYPTLAAVRAAKAEFLRQGREMIQEAAGGDVFEFAYFLFPEIGSAVEVLFLDGSKLPPPEGVIEPRP